MLISRRALFQVLLGLGASSVFNSSGMGSSFFKNAHADEGAPSSSKAGWLHAVSLLGVPKYPDGFQNFAYANPLAPKGGRARIGVPGSFDSLNPFSYKGDQAALISLTCDTLMSPSLDEPSTSYGLVAEALKIASDYSKVSYRIRQNIIFHDGTPATIDDIIWSMEALKRSHPQYALYYRDVVRAEKTGDRDVTFFFSEAGNRELPHIVGQLPLLSQKWWTSQDSSGKKRDLTQTTLEPFLGSGPYRVKTVHPGSLLNLERVADYWGRNLPVNRGLYHFNELSAVYFSDEQGMLDQFKAGEYDYRLENSAKNWAIGYDFPALQKGFVKKESVPSHLPQGMQAFAFNLRRPLFQDARVREAFNWIFDFEWANENLFFGQYTRTNSFFSNSELASSGLPTPGELALLTPLKDQIPAFVFNTPYQCPVQKTPEDRRDHFLKASMLFKEAGFQADHDGIMRDQGARPFSFEFLLSSRLFERIVLPYVRDLKRLGIQASVRVIDPAQYERRVQSFDYDIIVSHWGQSLSPGNEQRGFWGSAAADQPGSQNYCGIKNSAIDRLVDQIIFARTREDLISGTRALDRVLLWNHYVVPMWYLAYDRIAYWDRFGKPEPFPKYGVGFPSLWWWDEKKAKLPQG